jgi:protein arginine N-methyltransferase 3
MDSAYPPRGRLAADDNSDSSGSFGEWDDDADADAPIASLVGAHSVASAAAAWAELRAATGVDVPAEAAARGWDAYALVRVVNAARAAGREPAALRAALSADALAPGAPLWTDDARLRPVLEDDALIMAVIAGGGGDGEGDGGDDEGAGAGAGAGAAAAAAAAPAPSATEVDELRAELARARALIARLVASGGGGGEDDEDDDDECADVPARGGAALRDPHAGSLGEDNLTYYFDSYASKTGIHRTMLADAPRTLAYRDGVARPLRAGGAGSALAGARVLDLGCGSGILSLFCADAGAAAVVALDASSVIDDAAAIVRANGAAERVAVVFGRAEDVPLHRVRAAGEAAAAETGAGSRRVFDAIVSEWMGYALLYESMLASVLRARDAFLKPGGRMLPSVASLRVALVSDGGLWADRVAWWRDVYGYDFAVMARHAWPEPLVDATTPDSLASARPHATFARLELTSMREEEQDVRAAPWALTVAAPGGAAAVDAAGNVLIHALIVWFDVEFGDEEFWPPGADAAAGGFFGPRAGRAPGPPPVVLDTAPAAPATHWMQSLLLLREPLAAPAGAALAGTISMVRDARNPREYRFAVSVDAGPAAPRGVEQAWHMK